MVPEVAEPAEASEPAREVALRELDRVYSFIYSRVGNRADAEDLTQQVALKALPRLSDTYLGPAVRGYLYTTARSVMASFWSDRSRVPEAELSDGVADDGRGDELTAPPYALAWVEQVMSALPANYRDVLEMRFLRGYSLRETADAMGKTVGGVKVMQLRALRAAAHVEVGVAAPRDREVSAWPAGRNARPESPRSHRRPAIDRGSAFATGPAGRGG